jgi:hypothetical protein
VPRLLLVPVLLVLLLTSACGGDDVSVTADRPAPRETVTVTATPTPTVTPAPSAEPAEPTEPTEQPAPPPTDLSQYDVPGFTTPSGNIGCLFDDYQGPHVRCDRLRMTSVPPGKPADCDFDWGHSVELSLGQRGALACTSDSVMGQQGETDGSRALPYGDSVTYRGILCTSTRQGLTCEARGHGFLISRATIRVS